MEAEVMPCKMCKKYTKKIFDYNISYYTTFKDEVWMYECPGCKKILIYNEYAPNDRCRFIKFLSNKFHEDYIIWKLK